MFYTNLLSSIENNLLFSQKLEAKLLVIVEDKKYKIYTNNILNSRIKKQQKILF